MIIEGIVTTQNADGEVNIAPMGPIVDSNLVRLRLRPYQTSTTYQNLKAHGEGVFHVTDDVYLLARAAVGRIDPPPELTPCDAVRGQILADACQWYAFEVERLDDSQKRTEIYCRIIKHGSIRNFLGFNRAKHAVIEAAILATRLDFLDHQFICDEMVRLASPVEKTAGKQERQAFEFLKEYIDERLQPPIRRIANA